MPILSEPAGDDTRHDLPGAVRPAAGFNQVTANLGEACEDGLNGDDNTRYAVIEVRKQVPMLVIDGDPSDGRKPGGDTFHLQELFAAAQRLRGRAASRRGAGAADLDQYPASTCSTCRELSDKALKNLEDYVAERRQRRLLPRRPGQRRLLQQEALQGRQGPLPGAARRRPTQPLTDEEKFERSLLERPVPDLPARRQVLPQGRVPIFGEVAQGRIRERLQVPDHRPLLPGAAR